LRRSHERDDQAAVTSARRAICACSPRASSLPHTPRARAISAGFAEPSDVLRTRTRNSGAVVQSSAAHSLAPAQLRSIASAARTRLESLTKAQDAGIHSRLDAARRQLGLAAAALDALSPLGVLERGYAIAQTPGGGVIREARAVEVGDEVRLRLWKGSFDCRVEGTDINEA